MHARRNVALLLLAACTSSTEPKGPSIPAVVGAWCASTTPVVHPTSDDGRVSVDLSINTTTYQDVRRSDGVVIRQMVKGCRYYSCSFPPTYGTQQQMISACQEFAAQSA